jgi:DNA polymerase-3 subunit delta
VVEVLGINLYNRTALEEYKTAKQNFDAPGLQRIFALLHEYDLRSKGMNDGGTADGALLKELVYKILHPA